MEVTIFCVMACNGNKALLLLHKRESDVMCGGSPLTIDHPEVYIIIIPVIHVGEIHRVEVEM